MKLIIDSGNTLIKIAVFENEQLIHLSTLENISVQPLQQIINEYPVRHAIISDVRGIQDWPIPAEVPQIMLSGTTSTPLKMNYQSASSLGPDRLAASVCAAHLHPGVPVLVIQAGTCITYDFISAEGYYMGGGISPGLDLRFKAVHTFTGKLPLVKKKEIHFLIGTTTEDSILSGVMNGTIAEIESVIDQYRQNYPDLIAVMGGGDIIYFDKKLKNRIFAIENLVLRGLNLILEYNVNFKK